MSKKIIIDAKAFLIPAFIGVGVFGIILGLTISKYQKAAPATQTTQTKSDDSSQIQTLTNEVTPSSGFTLPISWGDLGKKLVSAGVIDEEKFNSAVHATDAQKNILRGGIDAPITINSQNAQFDVDLLWAVGLAQKSIVYQEGPMGTDYKKDAGNFASTGGWTLAKGDAVTYLGKFDLIPLTASQQNRVKEIAMNVYRPCCDNPTWFPDCNHGMAALAAIELMVSKDLPDDEIYSNLLKLNSFWFPQNYLTVAVYYDRQGITWDKVDAKKVLGKEFSSASGSQKLQSIVGPLPGQNNGGSCGA